MTSVKKVEEIISLSEKWFALSGSLFVAKVDPAATKGFFKSKKAAGRAYVAVDVANESIVLTDYMKGAEAFQAVTAGDVKAAAGLTEEEEKPAAATVKETTPATTKKATKKPVKTTAKKPAKKAAATKKTTAKKSKSKARQRLEEARQKAASLKKTVPGFVAFCEKINVGRDKPYSARNCELLYVQSGGKATCVKGFKSWQKEGRAVKRGEKALVIEAPRLITETDKKTGKEKSKLICSPVCVFDISQTEILKEA